MYKQKIYKTAMLIKFLSISVDLKVIMSICILYIVFHTCDRSKNNLPVIFNEIYALLKMF
jgi:hypothetical protein